MTSWRVWVTMAVILVAWSATCRGGEDDAVRDAILDSGPYPHPYLLPMPAALPGAAAASAKDWRLAVLRAMAGKGYATVHVAGDDVTWAPAPGNESRVRPHMDANYELIDYGLLLGTIDVSIDAVTVHGDTAEARVTERLDPSGLYRLVGPLIPAAVEAERLRTGTRTVRLEKTGAGWRITNGGRQPSP